MVGGLVWCQLFPLTPLGVRRRTVDAEAGILNLCIPNSYPLYKVTVNACAAWSWPHPKTPHPSSLEPVNMLPYVAKGHCMGLN